MGEERARSWLEAAKELMAGAWPFKQYDMATWEESSRLLPHLLAVVNLAAERGVATERVANLNGHAVFYLNFYGNLEAALPFARRALAIREKALGPDHPDTALSLNNLAFLHYDEGNVTEAARLMRRALAIREARLGAKHPDTESSRESLAVILAALVGSSSEEE